MRARSLLAAGALVGSLISAQPVQATAPFTISPLVLSSGGSEPSVTIGVDGQMAIDSLSWLQWGVNLWTGPFGSSPSFRGLVNIDGAQPGRVALTGVDADIDLGTTGTLHEVGLDVVTNPTCDGFAGHACQGTQTAITATTCPRGFATLADCNVTVLDTSRVDRPWITSNGPTVFVGAFNPWTGAYGLWRSDDDGYHWKRAGSPLTGQGSTMGQMGISFTQRLVVDPTTGDLFAVMLAEDPGAKAWDWGAFNNVWILRSTDGAKTWTARQLIHAPIGTSFMKVMASLAVDPVTGGVHVAVSDGHAVELLSSSNHGDSWSDPVVVNSGDASTAVLPWVAARAGIVDVVFYGTTGASVDDPAAVWNVFAAKSVAGGSFVQRQVSLAPNHVGRICTKGGSCNPSRQLLDVFGVAVDPTTGRAAIAYADDHTFGTPDLPQTVLAIEN